MHSPGVHRVHGGPLYVPVGATRMWHGPVRCACTLRSGVCARWTLGPESGGLPSSQPSLGFSVFFLSFSGGSDLIANPVSSPPPGMYVLSKSHIH